MKTIILTFIALIIQTNNCFAESDSAKEAMLKAAAIQEQARECARTDDPYIKGMKMRPSYTGSGVVCLNSHAQRASSRDAERRQASHVDSGNRKEPLRQITPIPNSGGGVGINVGVKIFSFGR